MILGIDPGLDGGIALLGPQAGRVRLFDMPTMPIPGDKAVGRRIDARGLASLLTREVGTETVDLVIIESLATGGFRGEGRGNAKTIGSQHRTRGQIEATLELLGLTNVREVAPITWKKLYGLDGGKDAKKDSLAKARALYPDAEAGLRRVLDHNRAEALLIAHWAKRKILGDREPTAAERAENPLL
jgi:hypothetical protein